MRTSWGIAAKEEKTEMIKVYIVLTKDCKISPFGFLFSLKIIVQKGQA